MTVLRGAAATDVGRVRQVNEDRYLVSDDLFAVADGVGGHQAGEVAAQTSVETLEAEFTERTTDGLVHAIQQANRAVWRLAQDRAERRGMGTTITALALVEEDGEELLAVANVGDSRAYLFQRSELEQITEDHSLVEELVREGQLTPEEAQVHPQRSIITRALGTERDIEVDLWTLIPYAGDRFLLCSDGLTNEVSFDRIASTLRQLSDPHEVARDLVRQARAHGGNDNITVVVVDVVDDGGRAEKASAALEREPRPATAPTEPGPDPRHATAGGAPAGVGATATAIRTRPPTQAEPSPPRRGRPRRFTWRVALFVAIVLGILGTAAATVAWYANSAYFVGLDGNQVAIFKGRPGGFLWFQPRLVERKPLTVDEVLPAAVDDLQAGREEPSKADADRYINNLRQEAAVRRGQGTTTTSPTTAPPTTGQP